MIVASNWAALGELGDVRLKKIKRGCEADAVLCQACVALLGGNLTDSCRMVW
jgi:aerobic-type carbon monoxide dehydrogenase small subunit (CoxS/CutS family)